MSTTPAAPAAPPKRGGVGTPLIILSFVLVFLILFDIPKGIRAGTAYAAGLVFSPLIGFNGKFPLLTIFLASLILVIATTAIRHFLIDWTKMARVQEAMRAYTNEMRTAQKANNTYKIKKLSDAQQDMMQLQADVQTDQMKPMAFTMLLVIPIFAWLGSYVGVPVAFDAQHGISDAQYAIVGMDPHLPLNGTILGANGSSFTTSVDLIAYPVLLQGNGTSSDITYDAPHTHGSFTVPLANAPRIPESAAVGNISAGTYSLTFTKGDSALAIADQNDALRNDTVHHVLVLLHETDGTWRVMAATDSVTTFTTNGATVYVLVPTDLATPVASGQSTLHLNDQTYPVTAANTMKLDAKVGVRIVPHESRVPWNAHWSYQDRAVLIRWHTPFTHWIALYSLFGIPVGQIAQRALKLWEYRHVDLDGDGSPASEAGR